MKANTVTIEETIPPADTSLGENLEDLAAEAAADAPAIEGGVEAPRTPSSEILKPMLRAVWPMMAPNWKVSGDESDQLSTALGDCMDKWFPENGVLGFFDRFKVELTLLGVAWAVVGKRVVAGVPMHAPAKKEVSATESAVSAAAQ